MICSSIIASLLRSHRPLPYRLSPQKSHNVGGRFRIPVRRRICTWVSAGKCDAVLRKEEGAVSASAASARPPMPPLDICQAFNSVANRARCWLRNASTRSTDTSIMLCGPVSTCLLRAATSFGSVSVMDSSDWLSAKRADWWLDSVVGAGDMSAGTLEFGIGSRAGASVRSVPET